MTASTESARVLVVGGGPAGLAAATELRRLGVGSVVVIERERAAGGVPRHCDHPGFGRRDLRRLLSGPDYAREITKRAVESGADVRLRSMVTEWAGERSLLVTSPEGRYRIEADAIVLATGARERPRSARLVPGDRTTGVLTTGQLQTLVHLGGRRMPGPAVVVGSELVSWSAVMTLRHAGVQNVVVVTDRPRAEVSPVVAAAARLLPRVRLRTSTSVGRISGGQQVESVELVDRFRQGSTVVPCRTVVFTGDWVPDHELARARGLELDRAVGGPVVDFALRTSAAGVCAAGNLLHPVDTADVAALDGRHVAAAVVQQLQGAEWPVGGVRLRVDPPLRWVAPGRFRPSDGRPANGRLLLWCDRSQSSALVVARQGARLIGRHRLFLPTGPGRVMRVPWSIVADAAIDGGDVTLSLR